MSSQPYAPALFADCLFNTDLLPPTIVDSFGTTWTKTVGLPTSLNGIFYGANDPEDSATLTRNIDNRISSICYNGAGNGFHSTSTNYSVIPSAPCVPTLANPTCRYVVMHQLVPNAQDAHQMQVDASGNPTYIYTTWTA